jgi:hypothetical protein
MGQQSLRDSQLEMARFLRNPDTEPAPEGIEPRRLKIYQDLVYNNIEGFICGGFPVLRTLYTDDTWHELVRHFIEGHRCHTPYFLEISQEFVNYLMNDYERRDCDPPFMAELAHYEWVELALDVSQDEIDSAAVDVDVDPLEAVPVLSPVAWVLSYRYPVHKIGAAYQPNARLLELVRENTDSTGTQLLVELAGELTMPEEAVLGFGGDQLKQFHELSIICGCKRR